MEIRFADNELKIPNTDWLNIQSVLNSFLNIDKVWLYGSRAKGTAKPYSDIDLALEGKNLTLEILNNIENALDDLLLPYEFDICILHQIKNQDLLEHIHRVGKLVYEGRRAV